jgi:RNA polymerase sigma factor (sigma-70 family)
MTGVHAGIVLQHLRRLAIPVTDAELLQHFRALRDEAAFAEMVRRHGPMVLSVCRAILRHEQDAEDAFQATFLALVRKADSIRHGDALVGWLYEVAYHAAVKARAGRARRGFGQLAAEVDVADRTLDMTLRDLQRVVHQELRRLPEKYRLPMVLCYLEGRSHADAARQLGWSKGTLRGRLDRGRERLRQRLERLGLAPAMALSAGALLVRAPAAPAALVGAVVRSALLPGLKPPAVCLDSAKATGLVRGVRRALLAMKSRVASAVLLTAGLVGAAALAHQGLSSQATSPQMAPAPQPDRPASPEPSRPHVAAGQKGETDSHIYSGRVLGPDLLPVAGAKVYLALLWQDPEDVSPAPVRATSGPDGRFHFQARVAAPDLPGLLVATAPGYGPGRVAAGAGRELTVKLAKDDVPIAGRVMDLQGRPVRGATVRVLRLRMALNPGADDLAPLLDALKRKTDASLPPENFSSGTATALRCQEFPTLPQAATTDADGRFHLGGIGRERMAVVLIEGPGIATHEVRILTRETAAHHLLEQRNDPTRSLDYYGATFTHVALPARPVVGVVRDRDTKKPLPGIKVQFGKRASEPSGQIALVETATDAQGRYRLAGTPRRRYDWVIALPAKEAPYLAASRDVGETEGLEAATVDFELKRGVWVRGRVTDEKTGKPLRCLVAYNVFENNPHFKDYNALFLRPPTAFTGDDGLFRLLLLPGRGLIGAADLGDRYCYGIGADRITGLDATGHFRTYPSQVSPRDYHTLVEVDPAREVENTTCNIVLRPGRTLSGIVLDPSGKPLAGARMRGRTASSQWWPEPLKTAEFEVLALEPDRARVVQFAHADKGLAGFLVVRPEDKGPLAVRLAPAGTLTGRVVNHQGRLLADLEVGAFFDDPPARRGQEKEKPPDGSFPGVRTGKDGRFRIEGLAAGLRYRLIILQGATLYDPKMSQPPTVEPGQARDLGDVRVPID